jgi:hypothetical protein
VRYTEVVLDEITTADRRTIPFFPAHAERAACPGLPSCRSAAEALRGDPNTLLHVRYIHSAYDLWVQSCDWDTGVAHTYLVRRDGATPPTWGFLRLNELEPAPGVIDGPAWQRDHEAGPVRLADLPHPNRT